MLTSRDIAKGRGVYGHNLSLEVFLSDIIGQSRAAEILFASSLNELRGHDTLG